MIDPALTPNELSKRGIAAARAGRMEEAREYLMAAVEADEGNEQAWLWLGGLMPELEDQIVCLENALHLNPNNPPAAAKLKKLYAKRDAQSPPPSNNNTIAVENQFAPANPFGATGSNAAPANPFSAGAPANPFTTTPAPANPFSAAPPSPPPPSNSPAVTQVMSNPPHGALPWDDFTAKYGNTSSIGSGQEESEGDTGFGSNPFSGSASAIPAYQPCGHTEQRGHSTWEQPGTQQMYSYASESNPHEDYLASAITGTQYIPSDNQWSRENELPPSYEAGGAASGFASQGSASSYADFNNESSYSSASYSARYGDASASSFELPSTEDDERLDCPYCGWHTRMEDDRCPNCGGELNLYVRQQEGRSSALMTVVLFWVVRALKSAYSLGATIILLNASAKAFSSVNVGNATLSAPVITDAMRRTETVLITYYGIVIGLALIMAIGSWSRMRAFYYINFGVVVLSLVAGIVTYLIDPRPSPTILVIDVVVAIVQFIMITRAEADFIPQKQRIVEPVYRGEASALGFFNLGTQYQKAGYTALAAKAWRRSVGLSPGEARGRVALATAYNKMKRYDLAVQELTDAIKINPNEPRFHNLMAITKMRQGDFEAARRYVASAFELKPNDPDTLDTEKLIEEEAKKVAGKTKEAKKPATSQ